MLVFQTKDVKTMQIEKWGRVKIKTKDKDEGQAYFWLLQAYGFLKVWVLLFG